MRFANDTVLPIRWDGKPISAPGFYSHVPMSAYHSGKLCVGGPTLSSSGLRTIFHESEAHFFDRWPLNPDHEPQEENEAMILGRAVHHMLLGQPRFFSEFVIRPDELQDSKTGETVKWNGNRAACKNWLAAQAARNLTVVTSDMGERIKGMAARLGREPLVGRGVLNGLIEITMVWKHASGVWLLARPDVIPTDGGDFCDLKTMGKGVVDHNTIVRAIGEHGYNQQAALVADGWKALMGQSIQSFSFYFIESRRPYCAKMVTLRDRDLDLGRRQNDNAIRRFVMSAVSGSWPGPGGPQSDVEYVSLSQREVEAIERELGDAQEQAA